MKNDRSLLAWLGVPLIAGLLLIIALLWTNLGRWREDFRQRVAAAGQARLPKLSGAVESNPSENERVGRPGEPSEADIDALLDGLLRKRVQAIGAIENEAILRFKTKEAYDAFLKRAAAGGLKVLARLDDLRAVRVGYDGIDALRREVAGNMDDLQDVGANFLVKIPGVPEPEDRSAAGNAPFGDDLFGSLGATGDRSAWGQGVTVAVLDAGLTAHPTFGASQVTHVDLVRDGQPFNGHGDAMGSLIAGTQPGAEGLAPAAHLLDVRIFDGAGEGDSFILAQGIQQAVAGGAQIINISGASYGDALVVREAIAAARERGVTVIAAVGNEQAGIKAYPAAYEGVVAVSGVDSQSKLAYFSNSGDPTLAAPAVGVPSAYSENGKPAYVYGDGTSQATALTSGAAALLLSRGENPATALTRYTRPAEATSHEVGAGILYFGGK